MREIVSLSAAVYHPRNPQDSDYYRCVEDYFETFVQIYVVYTAKDGKDAIYEVDPLT